MSVNHVIELHVDASFNASALQTKGVLGILGTRCILTIGIPMLVLLSREQLRTVIAHELGHFSRRHGALGHWLYRVRVTWEQYLNLNQEYDSVLDKACAWYAAKFVPYFIHRMMVYSKQCEYEADADAASIVGAQAMAHTLTQIELLGLFWSHDVPKLIRQWQTRNEQIHSDFYQQLVLSVSRVPAEQWDDY